MHCARASRRHSARATYRQQRLTIYYPGYEAKGRLVSYWKFSTDKQHRLRPRLREQYRHFVNPLTSWTTATLSICAHSTRRQSQVPRSKNAASPVTMLAIVFRGCTTRPVCNAATILQLPRGRMASRVMFARWEWTREAMKRCLATQSYLGVDSDTTTGHAWETLLWGIRRRM